MANNTTERDGAVRADRPAGDRLGGETDGAAIDESRARRAANLFDLRRLIGGLFVLYGVILTVLGINASDAEIEKAAGLNLNLWTGLAMLLVGALFLVWAFARPLSDQLDEDDEAEREEQARFTPDTAGSTTAGGGTGRDPAGTAGEGRFGRE